KVGGVNMEKEIILVDDRSTDGTRELLKEKIDGKIAGIKVFYHEKNKGKGSAVRTALEHADGDYCIIQDADLEYDPEDYISLIARAMDGKEDVVYGSRFLRTWKTTSFTHYMVNGSLTFLTNLLFGSGLTDMETCYKLVRTDVMKSLDLKADRFELEPEITAKLLKKGHKIPEIPVSYKGRSYHEGKKIGWKDGIEAVITLFRLKFSRNK
ncbi:MAG: glycosyltransferase family 2 protein, partial [Candidatus Omnitrophica bacterium]|nr:glycosyltransferase family 2 protein [Candidatus Omnitrophota bacterium]